jgi:CubicO group peptidase (beta-lactamase class C family)
MLWHNWSYDALVEEEILRPLGMTMSGMVIWWLRRNSRSSRAVTWTEPCASGSRG